MRKIEKGVPCEWKEGSYGRAAPGRPVYPEFRVMEVGDSVFFEDQPKGGRSNVSVASHIYGKKSGKKFSSAREGDGVRIWRIK